MKDAVDSKIVREDWIGRFFGYLGSMEYMRSKGYIGKAALKEEIGKKADNIVFIYSGYKEGISFYMRKLIEELHATGEYACCSYNFGNSNCTGKEFIEKFFMIFQNEFVDFSFPCMGILKCMDGNWEKTAAGILENMWDTVDTLVAGSGMSKIKEAAKLVIGMNEYIQYKKTMPAEEKKVLEELRSEIKEMTQMGVGSELLFDEEDPFNYLRLDLRANIRRKKNKKSYVKTICMIDRFDLCKDSIGYMQENLLQLMAEMEDIIWVLFSREKPNELARPVVYKENCWRMTGLNKRRTMDYLKEMCPDESMEWYEAVCENTGGYLGLIDLCVKAQNSKKSSNSRAYVYVDPKKELWDAYMRIGMSEELAQQQMEGFFKNHDEKSSAREQLEKWFACVWNEGPYMGTEMGQQEWDEPISFLFEKEFRLARSDKKAGNYQDYLASCLFYLADRSIQNVGTINQFCWEKGSTFTELDPKGQDCIRWIENSTPYCIEYVEYPGVLYLDPVIVRVLIKHKNFASRLEEFKAVCFRQEADVPDKEFHKKERVEKEIDVKGSAKKDENDVMKTEQQVLEDDVEKLDNTQQVEKIPTVRTESEMQEKKEEKNSNDTDIVPPSIIDTHNEGDTTVSEGQEDNVVDASVSNEKKPGDGKEPDDGKDSGDGKDPDDEKDKSSEEEDE